MSVFLSYLTDMCFAFASSWELDSQNLSCGGFGGGDRLYYWENFLLMLVMFFNVTAGQLVCCCFFVLSCRCAPILFETDYFCGCSTFVLQNVINGFLCLKRVHLLLLCYFIIETCGQYEKKTLSMGPKIRFNHCNLLYCDYLLCLLRIVVIFPIKGQ